jgi:YHS domain-containing protein
MIKRQFPVLAAIAGLALAMSAPSYAVKQTGGEFNTLYAGIGIKGYDPVGYFTDNKAMVGDPQITAEYGGVTWRFASAKHRDMFVKEPEKYVPQYGGFCSLGVGVADKLFDVDPEKGWTVFEGKLYMNFDAEANTAFRRKPVEVIHQADRNWPGLNH